jgi:GT2 family glycosyltransferase
MAGITEIDIIILSYGQNSALRAVTEQCIASLLDSEDPQSVKFNVVVIESEKMLKGYQYNNSITIYPEAHFGYNKFMNIGIELTSSKYVCLCNNDLVFRPFWATEMLKAFDTYYDLSSASPICSIHHPTIGFELNSGLYAGYRNRYEVAGWCLFLKRDVLRIMGKLDENYRFWCADNDFANMLSSLHLGHALVSSSVVDHLEGYTSDQQLTAIDEGITSDEFFYLEKKWNSRIGLGWKLL